MGTEMNHVPVTLRPQSAQDVKLKFFQTIGLGSPQKPSDPNATSSVENSSWAHRIHQVPTFQEELKYDPKEDQKYAKTSSPDSSNNKRKKKVLSFDEKVEVVPIPMRSEYSNRVKARLWSNAIEIQENAARNSLEFAHEGWEWRNVLEDDQMYVCIATSELVHPCHYEPIESHGFR